MKDSKENPEIVPAADETPPQDSGAQPEQPATHKKNKTLMYVIIIVTILALIGVVATWYLMDKNSQQQKPDNDKQIRSPRRITLYTNYDGLDGSPCPYYEYEIIGKTKSNRSETCVDNVEKASDLIPNTGAYSSNRINGIRLIKIDADVHTETQRLSPSTPEPQYDNYEVIVIDNVYSAELFVSNTTK